MPSYHVNCIPLRLYSNFRLMVYKLAFGIEMRQEQLFQLKSDRPMQLREEGSSRCFVGIVPFFSVLFSTVLKEIHSLWNHIESERHLTFFIWKYNNINIINHECCQSSFLQISSLNVLMICQLCKISFTISRSYLQHMPQF